MSLIGTVLCPILIVFLILLIIRVLFSWIPRPPDPLLPVENVARVTTEWAVAPLRNLIPPVRTGAVAFDLSILVLFFGVQILLSVVC